MLRTKAEKLLRQVQLRSRSMKYQYSRTDYFMTSSKILDLINEYFLENNEKQEKIEPTEKMVELAKEIGLAHDVLFDNSVEDVIYILLFRLLDYKKLLEHKGIL